MKTNRQLTIGLCSAVLLTANFLSRDCAAAQIHGMVCLKNQGAIGMEGVIVTLTGPNDLTQATNTGKDGKYRFSVPATGAFKLTYERVGKCLVATPQSTTLTSRNDVVRMDTVCAHDGSTLSAVDAVEAIILRATATPRPEKLMHTSVLLDLEALKAYTGISPAALGQITAEFENKPIHQRIEEAKFPEITTSELRSRIRQGKPLVIFDANGSEFYRLCHIKGSVDYEAVRKNVHQYLQPHSQAVAYCGPLGLKAKGCAESLIQLGFTNVVRLKGGLPGWVDGGGEVFRSVK